MWSATRLGDVASNDVQNSGFLAFSSSIVIPPRAVALPTRHPDELCVSPMSASSFSSRADIDMGGKTLPGALVHSVANSNKGDLWQDLLGGPPPVLSVLVAPGVGTPPTWCCTKILVLVFIICYSSTPTRRIGERFTF